MPSPMILAPNLDGIPAELRQEARWVVWKAGPLKPTGKFDKIPVSPATGQNLTGDVSSQGMTFDKAVAALSTGRFSGLGFHPKGSPFVIGDIDRVVEPDGSIAPWALEDIGGLATYCEVSPSGTGLRWIAIGTKPGPETNNRGCELYDSTSKQFLTITGRSIAGFGEIRSDIQPQVNAWYFKRISKGRPVGGDALAEGPGNDLPVEAIIERLLSTEKGRQLWEGEWGELGHDSRSEHEMALLNKLAMLTAGELEKMREIYLDSPFATGIYEDKAERTFEGCARKAIASFLDRGSSDGLELITPISTADGARHKGRPLYRDVEELPDSEVEYLIEGHIPSDGVTLVYGDSGAFKSFVAVDLAYCVATGREWHGFEVKQGPVLYIVGEGGQGIRKRARAWRKANGVDTDSPIWFWTVPVAFSVKDQIALVQEAVSQIATAEGRPPVMLIVDTLARCFGPGDENTQKNMNRFLAGVDVAMHHKGARVVLHHVGHKDKDRARGSYALIAALDANIHVRRVETAGNGRPGCILESRKQRDDEKPEPLAFATEVISLGENSQGRWQSSLILKRIPASNVTVVEVKLNSKQQQMVALLQKHGAMSDDEFARRLVAGKVYSRSDSAQRGIDRLREQGHIRITEGGVVKARACLLEDEDDL